MTKTNETSATKTVEIDIVAAGKKAMQAIQRSGKRLIDEWVKVGKALSVGEAIGSKKERGKWHREHFPDLAGPKFASTRNAAVWLASLPGPDVQQFHNDGKLNHPVTFKRAYEKAHGDTPVAEKASSKAPASQRLADPGTLALAVPAPISQPAQPVQRLVDPATFGAMIGELVRMDREKALAMLREIDSDLLAKLFDLTGDVTLEQSRMKRAAA